MAKSDGILGISVRHGKLSLATMKGLKIQKTIWEEIPENIVDDYKITSQNLFADFLRDKIKENGIKCKKAAYVIADADVFIKEFTLPSMDDEQLRLNVPFEFRDFIQGDLKDYAFDFVKRNTPKEGEGSEKINILAFAVSAEYLTFIRETMKLAGLKLDVAIPETSVYETILQRLGVEEERLKERCLMDIGNNHISMRIFKNGNYKISHVIDIGEKHIVQAIADDMNVDMHLATTYLRTNYENCLSSEAAIKAYKDISLEVLKGLNFYELSDMSSRLKEVDLCGAGAMIEPLVSLLKERIDKEVHTMQELFPDYGSESNIDVTGGAVGVLFTHANGQENVGHISGGTNENKVNWAIAIPLIVAVIALAGLFGKFGVYDRFVTLDKETRKIKQLEDQLSEQNGQIEALKAVSDEYSHYTWNTLSEEERNRVSRLEVMQLVDFIEKQGANVNYFNLTGSDLLITVNTKNLENVSALMKSLDEQEIVASTSMVSAKTIDEEEKTNSTVDAQIKIYLKTKSQIDEGKEGNEN